MASSSRPAKRRKPQYYFGPTLDDWKLYDSLSVQDAQCGYTLKSDQINRPSKRTRTREECLTMPECKWIEDEDEAVGTGCYLDPTVWDKTDKLVEDDTREYLVKVMGKSETDDLIKFFSTENLHDDLPRICKKYDDDQKHCEETPGCSWHPNFSKEEKEKGKCNRDEWKGPYLSIMQEIQDKYGEDWVYGWRKARDNLRTNIKRDVKPNIDRWLIGQLGYWYSGV